METGFVRSETLHNGTFDVLSRQPNPRLRAFVHDYQGYIDHTPDEFSRRKLPGGRVVFIISFGPPYVVSNGRLLEIEVDGNRREIEDFNGQTPDPQPSPAWARDWPMRY